MELSVDRVFQYFPELTDLQKSRFSQLKELYEDWNSKINVISRKDMDSFYIHHVLHSLAIAKCITFKPGSTVLDFGCGGGFPGIPLAILFPEVQFLEVDSIAKKIKVVAGVAESLGLENLEAKALRVETLDKQFDYITCRAVAPLIQLRMWTKHLLKKDGNYVFLKGGDLNEEINETNLRPDVFRIANIFEEEFFETKQVLVIKP